MKSHLIAGASVLALVVGSSSLALAQAQQKMEGGNASPGVSQGAPKGAAKGASDAARSEGRGQTGERGPSSAPGKSMTPGKSTSAPNNGSRNANAPKNDEGKKSASESKSSDDNRKGNAKRTTEEKSSTKSRDNRKAAEEQRRDSDRRGVDQRTKSAEPRHKGDSQQKSTQDRSKASDRQERSVSGGATKGSSGVTTGSVNAPSRVELTGEKRTKVLGVFERHRSEARETVNVQVEVGRPVPRSVRLFVIPEEIVDIVPQYRHYRYFIVGDVVLIVDPDRFVIVDVLPIAA